MVGACQPDERGQWADRIITLERGRITETGTHSQLLSQRGRYASLYAKQMGTSLEAEART